MPRWEHRGDPATLASRLRARLRRHTATTEKRMFGGVCFLLRGNMLCGAAKPGYIFRIDPADEDAARALPGAIPMVQGGREMRGFFWVDPEGCDAAALSRWLRLAEAYVGKMPPKPPNKGKNR